MKKTINFALCVLILFSCAKPYSGKSTINWQAPVWNDNADFLNKKDPACQNHLTTSISLPRYYNGRIQRENLDFSEQLALGTLSHQNLLPISKTIYEQKFHQYIYLVYDTGSDDYKALTNQNSLGKLESEGTIFSICDDYYENDDLEAVALSASYSIYKTYKKFVMATKLNLEAISLSVQPYIKRTLRFRGGKHHLKQLIQHMTDNAFYNPQTKEISILPKSKKNDGPGLWELPMVSSHEYGHHIFHTIMQTFTNSDQPFYGCFNKDFTEVKTQLRKADSEFALKSINEGFADLIAFYTLEAKEVSLKDVSCFEKNREVDSWRFADGTKKIFDQTARESMNSFLPDKNEIDCNSPDYQSIHDVGAIFAYNLNKLYSDHSFNQDIKLRALTNFLKVLGPKLKTLKELNPSDFLFEAMQLAYAEMLKLTGLTVTQQHCDKITRIFDGYQPQNGCRLSSLR